MMLLLTGVGLNNTAAMAQTALLPHRPSAMKGEEHLWPLKNSWTNKKKSCNDGNGYIYIYIHIINNKYTVYININKH